MVDQAVKDAFIAALTENKPEFAPLLRRNKGLATEDLDDKGNKALHFAETAKQVEALKVYDHINTLNKDDETPALKASNTQVAKALEAKGADVSFQNKNGKNFLHTIAESSDPSMATDGYKLLYTKLATSATTAGKFDQKKLNEKLSEYQSAIDTKSGHTPLHAAIAANNEQALNIFSQIFPQSGIDITTLKNARGETILDTAISANSKKEIFTPLLNKAIAADKDFINKASEVADPADPKKKVSLKLIERVNAEQAIILINKDVDLGAPAGKFETTEEFLLDKFKGDPKLKDIEKAIEASDARKTASIGTKSLYEVAQADRGELLSAPSLPATKGNPALIQKSGGFGQGA